MYRYYGVNLIEAIRTGHPSPRVLLGYLTILPLGSATGAMLAGNRSQIGWDMNVEMAANIVDAVNANTVATGVFKKTPTVEPLPRPWDEHQEKTDQAASIQDAHTMLARAFAV